MPKGVSTQQFVPIERVRDGVVVLKTGEIRTILITSSLNLGLKSDDEQKAVLSQFQNFLNSLDFPIEFFVQSRKLNIKPYMDLLQERSLSVKEDLLKIQIHEYMGFIKKFTDESSIMTKHFFITIPYYGQESKEILSGMMFKSTENPSFKNSDVGFEAARMQLEQRTATVMQGLSRFGLRAQRLGTEEVVELFYKLFNPGEGDHKAPSVS